MEGAVGGDGIHLDINTRAEFESYDPAEYTIVGRVGFEPTWSSRSQVKPHPQ